MANGNHPRPAPSSPPSTYQAAASSSSSSSPPSSTTSSSSQPPPAAATAAAAATATSRVAQLSNHLANAIANPPASLPRPLSEVSRPFSTSVDDSNLPSTLRYNMSGQQFKQDPHKLLVIPGPIEVADDVLYANAHPSVSHVSPDFVPVFGDCIRMLRKVLFAPDAQPVITSGSGTLGWDHVAANVSQPGDEVLVLNSGYFGDSFTDCFETYGVKVDQIKAPIGSRPALADVEAKLRAKKYKVVTFTHVDTSTGVLSDAKALGELVKRVSPESVLVLDGVCSVGSEEIRMAEWGIDVVLTASQKGLGCPPGLMVLAASKKAIAAFEKRTVPPNSYFASWAKWLPVMRAYEAGTGAYFGTPPTNLIYALHQSLTTMTTRSPSLEERFRMHVEASNRVKRFVSEELGLEQLVSGDGTELGAHGMTAVKYPAGLKATDLLPKLIARNVVMAAGLHKEVKDTYFRIGHMGVTVVDEAQRGDIAHLLKSLKESLAEAGYKK